MTLTLTPVTPRQTPRETPPPFSAGMLEEYVAAHGFGDMIPEAMGFARLLHAEGDDESTIAFEIVARVLTHDLQPTAATLPVLANTL